MRRPTLPVDKIITHEDGWIVPYVQWVRTFASRSGLHAPAQDGVTAGADVLAYINHGRWIAECPAEGCNGAQVASEKTRQFWCLHCGNAEIDFAWRHVRFPRYRTAIESILVQRPSARADRALTRNWVRGETVIDLRAENVKHGVPA